MPHPRRQTIGIALGVALALPFTGCSADWEPSARGGPAAAAIDGLSAVPSQYRLDWAKHVFQLGIRNGTDERFHVVGVRLEWDGFTTPVAERDDTVTPGQTIDFPVAVTPSNCPGNGAGGEIGASIAVPPIEGARVVLTVDDGTERVGSITDDNGVLAQLYLDDCVRQRVAQAVRIEWADLHTGEIDGRPVTEGVLRLMRGAAEDDITIIDVGNTILFNFDRIDGVVTSPVVVLPAGEQSIEVPMRFLENRCDAHARAESSQSFRFFSHVDLGDGEPVPFEIIPTIAQQAEIRATFEDGCASLGAGGFIGES
ncbi:MAG: hypothetical protein WD023_08885 [Ilumatobacteraceae bacterium]